jgi:hypothetical protein
VDTFHSIQDIPIEQNILNSSPIPENSFSISSPSPTISLRGLHRTKSLTDYVEKIKTNFSRSASLPPMRFDIKDRVMLTLQSTITDSNDDNYSMPMIVNVEENVEINHQKVKRSKIIYSLVVFLM